MKKNTYFKIDRKSTYEKFLGYVSIFALVLGSTFGSLNSAYAADVTANGVAIVNANLADTSNLKLTDDETVVLSEDDTVADIDTLLADATLDISGGVLTSTGAVTAADGTDLAITISTGDGLIVGGAIISDDPDTDSLISITLEESSTLELITDNDDDIQTTIDGDSGGNGTLTITGDTKDMMSAIGGTNHLALITVAGDTTQFEAAATVNATTLTITGASTSFLGAVGADTINLAAGTTTIDGLITNEAGTGSAAIVLDDGAGQNVLDIGKAGTHKFDATVQADSEGEINTTIDAVVIDGTIATSTALIADLDLDGNTTINGDFYADLTHVADGKTLTAKGNNGSTLVTLDDATAGVTFSGTSAQTSKTIDGDAAFLGVITASNAAGVTFSTEIGATNGVDKLVIDGVDLPEVIVSLDGNKIGEIDMDTDATLRLAKTITNGQTVFAMSTDMEDTDVATGSKIYMPVNLSNGQTLKLFTTVTQDAAFTTALNLAVQDTALIDYSAAITDTDDYTVTATAKTESATASALSVTLNDAKGMKQAFAAAINDTVADDAAEEAFKNALNQDGGYSSTEDTSLAKQVAPQTDLISGSSVAAQAVTGSVQGIMSSRMASLRSGDAYFGTGVAAGGMSAQSGFIQVFGSTAEQNNRTVGSGTQFGYESDTEGLAIGFDGVTDDGMTIGLSLATANTDVDGKGTGKSTNTIDTYSASLYMDRATDAGYVEGSVTFG